MVSPADCSDFDIVFHRYSRHGPTESDMAVRRTPTSDELRRSLLTLLTVAQAVVFLIGIGALLGGIAAVVADRPTVGLTLGACGLAVAVVVYAFLSYLQWRVTVADEQARAEADPRHGAPRADLRSDP